MKLSCKKLKLCFAVSVFIFLYNSILSQQLNISLSSTENFVCNGVGCNYNGPSILINEIMLSPDPFDGSIYGITPSHNPATHCRGEWIELYNPDECKPVDISCYFLGNAAYESSTLYPAGFILPEGTIVPPRGFVIIRGVNAPAVPSNLLVQNGGNTIEIIVNDISRICLSGGYRLWFPNAGGWFAFYDRNGVPQDAISWNNNNTPGFNACNPGAIGGCNYTGPLVSYNNIPAERKNYISSNTPPYNKTYRRVPDGGAWAYNQAVNPTYGTCNSDCIPEPIITCNGTVTVSISGGTPPYSIHWDDGQAQTTATAQGLCEGQYCVTVTDANNQTTTGCIYVYNHSLTVEAVSSTQTVCAGSTLNMQVNYSQGQAPYSISWNGPQYFSSNQANVTIPNSTTSHSGVYSVTVTDDHGCIGTSQVNITVNPNPNPTASNNGPVCPGETLSLNTQSFSSYSWSGPGNFSSNQQNPSISNFQSYQTGTYTLTVTNQHGCTATASTAVTILPSPEVSITGQQTYCQGQNIQLSASPGLNNYTWTGPNGFTASGQTINIPNSQPSMSGTYSVNVSSSSGCPGAGNYQITVYPMVNATISPVGNLCITDPVVLLNAVTPGGIWSGPGVSGNAFNPQIAGVGTHTISYSISNPACSDSDTEIVNVYNPVQVMNFNDQECNDTYTEYTVSFNVVDHLNNPTPFLANSGNGFQPFNGSFSLVVPSATPYNITVVDPNFACSEYIFQGMRDCGCLTYAGTMTSVIPVQLCYGQCTDMITHNNNQELDADDTFGFVLHTGGYPPNIIAYNSTPEFCYHLIPSLNFGQTYYISAVAGNEISPGVPDMSDPCFSISQGTPVVWYDIPISHINSPDFSICGLEACFSAQPAPSGMTGFWSCPQFFVTTQGTSTYSPNICVLVSNHTQYNFIWNVNNGNCTAKDTIKVTFVPKPTAYAGEDFSICGYSTDLNAILSLTNSTGFWSGPGTFSNQNSTSTSVSISPPPGSRTFTWREINGECWDEDQITVNFIQPPNPSIVPVRDTVCGNNYQLNVLNVQGTGIWNALVNGQQPPFQVSYVNGQTNPQTQVSITNYNGHYTDVQFIWTETIQVSGIQCTSSVSQNIIFSKMPSASVGPVNEAERCGNCIELQADVTGSEWAQGTWIPMNIIGQFTSGNPNSIQATYCINEPGSYGDTAHVRVPFIWAMRNYACVSVDTMFVTFYRRPQANAGIDKSICGNFYTLGAVYSISETQGYNPSGMWSVFSRPDTIPTPSANFENLNNDTTNVSVSHTGIWQFVFRENNTYLTSCYSTDTVRIEFVENPIIYAGPDKNICGNATQMEAVSAGFPGSWVPNGAYYDDFANPTTPVMVNNYGPINFTWIETNHANLSTLSCSAMDQVTITFYPKPTATILTDEADSTVCGLTFPRLRAAIPGTGITGYWTTNNPFTLFSPNPYTWQNASATVPSYGYHDFYWIVETGPEDMPGFCTDTAGPLRIHFIQIPTANAGNDTLFCGFTGNLNAIPSVGSGVWSTPSTQNISFNNPSSPNAIVTSNILNAGNPGNPFFLLIWTEDNTNGCTDKDTIKVQFARIPSSETIIIPPKCFGEEATIRAVEDTLQQYTWNFFNGQVVQSFTNSQDGNHRNFVRWNDGRDFHVFNLITTNFWGCNSPIAIDTVYEPPIPEFDVTIIKDTCALGKGGLIFNENSPTTAFFWINTEVGPAPGPITQLLNIPAGDYGIRTSYLTPNTQYISHYLSTFGTQYCIDTFFYTIPTVGMIEAMIEVAASVDLENLVAPNAVVTFLNNSVYDDVRKRCEWNFGDGTKLKNCDPMVEHTYTKSGCYEPFLIVMNRDLPECRDTARLSACIQVDDESMLEIPNIFSPNGDGINDFFQVKAKTLKTFTGQIVNRYGRIVYTWENWQDYEAGWDGNLEGGTKAVPGVYYYIIKATGWDDKEYNEQGVLHLMRD